tara:strand:+ start:199 stop:426 length:228 start_codon:yes stop_codon:yes gene_type:complete
MPFQIVFGSKGHRGIPYPHYHLYKFEKKEMGKRHFKTKQAAINSAKQAIMFREKKKSKVVQRGGKTYVVPIGYKF